VDADGKKQGKWVIYGKMSGDATYNPTDKVQEGNYKDDLKEGAWVEYNPGGTIKRTVNYAAGQEVK
jgi:antitoxin component YwqK of YwqJK toxin-antitoxin module